MRRAAVLRRRLLRRSAALCVPPSASLVRPHRRLLLLRPAAAATTAAASGFPGSPAEVSPARLPVAPSPHGPPLQAAAQREARACLCEGEGGGKARSPGGGGCGEAEGKRRFWSPRAGHGMADGARPVLGGSRGSSPLASPLLGRGGKSRSLPTPASTPPQQQQQTPPASPKQPQTPPRGSAPGHCFKRVTLTKPTFCHCCTDFIWGLAGYLCEGEARAWGSLCVCECERIR